MDTPWQLNEAEMALVQNAQWLLTKQQITEKVYTLFGRLSATYTSLQQRYPLPEAVTAVSPKIARGEYYRQLPYVILDQPRFFQQHHALAIRSFFWWGHSFSLHLHLAGDHRNRLLPALTHALQSGALQHWHTVTGADQWQHHFAPDNYQPVSHLTTSRITQAWQQQSFLKLAVQWPLNEWHLAPERYTAAYEQLLQWIT